MVRAGRRLSRRGAHRDQALERTTVLPFNALFRRDRHRKTAASMNARLKQFSDPGVSPPRASACARANRS